jgi:protein-S-isoprenylcysteine O-methyltransferase Ste14
MRHGIATSGSKEKDRAGVIVPPPLIYLTSVLVGVFLDYIWPLQMPLASIATWVGMTLMLASGLLSIAAHREFRRAGTPVNPNEPTSAIVRTGPYRVSRNPLYVALSLLQVGVGLWLENVWIVAMLPPALVVMWWGVVAREERYLVQKFGQEYLDYKSSVHRWL